MGEVGCLKDGNFQNLQVGGGANLSFGALETRFPNKTWSILDEDGLTPLVANTFYTVNIASGGDATFTLPAASVSNKGDFIHMLFIEVLANAGADTFILTAPGSETLAVGSTCIAPPGIGFAGVFTSPSIAANTTLTLVGTANGCAAHCTTVDCFFNGSNWAVKAVIRRQGSQAGGLGATAFST